MLGEAVVVHTRAAVGEDGMGEPEYEWASERVEGVLVRPLSGSDERDAGTPDRTRADYSLAFPKGYVGELANARVSLVERGMGDDPEGALRIVGRPDRTRPCPTMWDMVAEAAAVHG